MESNQFLYFLSYNMGALIFLVFTLSRLNVLQRILSWSRKKWFAFFMYCYVQPYNCVLKDIKRKLFASMTGDTVLEIGVGSGANLEYYPEGTKLTVYEPNEHFKDYLRKNLKGNKKVTLEKFVVGKSEDMSEIQSESVSTVVCTLVLCSVSDSRQVLKEVLRVLKPGGRFFFLEHVVAEKGTLLYFIQHVLNTFWWILLDDCCLTKRSWEDIESVGFSNVELQKFSAQRTLAGIATEVIRPHIVGIATK